MSRVGFVFFISLVTLPCVVHGQTTSSEGLTASINQEIETRWQESGIEPAARATDREFCRRLYLDLAGRIPSTAELETFLADGRKDKRAALIETLLESEDYVQHFADLFDALLMGRGDARVYDERNKHGWRGYLERMIRENRRWDEVVTELVLARPSNEIDHGAQWFLYERKNEHQQIAEAVAPAIFGFRIECAQCHDHPIAAEILQEHYWGLVAFFNRSKNVSEKKGPQVSESAIGGFSEFADLTGDSRPNLLSFIDADVIAEERPEKEAKQEDRDDLYLASKQDGLPREPKFSRREAFAEQVVADHPRVARALANRIWAMMMARGIVHPFDEMDSVHEPSHPALLDLLASELQDSGFDLRRLIEAIANSNAYQLSSIRSAGHDDPSLFAWYLERPLTAEQYARSMQIVVRGEFKNDAKIIKPLRQQMAEVLPDESTTTIKETLFLSNNQAIEGFLRGANQANDIVPRLRDLPSQEQQVDALFMAAFQRAPSSIERSRLAEYLGSNVSDERFHQVVWAVLTSAEFRFNH